MKRSIPEAEYDPKWKREVETHSGKYYARRMIEVANRLAICQRADLRDWLTAEYVNCANDCQKFIPAWFAMFRRGEVE